MSVHLRLFEIARVLVSLDNVAGLHRKRESQRYLNGCRTFAYSAAFWQVRFSLQVASRFLRLIRSLERGITNHR